MILAQVRKDGATAARSGRVLPTPRSAEDAFVLETDKPENVRLYKRFGYHVTAEAEVLGVTSWFMTRESTPLTRK